MRVADALPLARRLPGKALAPILTPDVRILNNANWEIVKSPTQRLTAYTKAIRVAEAACAMSPHNSDYLNTLGVARFRVGEYADALVALRESDQINRKTNPAASRVTSPSWQ